MATIKPKCRSACADITSILIINQSALDFFACGSIALTFGFDTSMTSYSSKYFSNNSWNRTIMCILLDSHLLIGIGVYGSIANLVLISAERYSKIVHPVFNRKHCQPWMIYVALGGSWLDGIIAITP